MKNYVRTNITLPRELAVELKKRVPKRSYSRTISVALKEFFEKEKSWNFLNAAGILARGKTPEEAKKSLKESLAVLKKIEELDIKDTKALHKYRVR